MYTNEQQILGVADKISLKYIHRLQLKSKAHWVKSISNPHEKYSIMIKCLQTQKTCCTQRVAIIDWNRYRFRTSTAYQ